MDANTPATPSFPAGNPIENNPIENNPIENNPVRNNPIQDSPVNGYVSAPSRPKGPNSAAVVLGLLSLLFAGLIIANETIGLQVDWSRLGPGAIIGIGGLLVVLGAIGLVRRHDDT